MTTPGAQGPESPQHGGTPGWGQAPAGTPSFPPPQQNGGFPPPQDGGFPPPQTNGFPPPAGAPQGAWGAPGQPAPGQPPFGAQPAPKAGRGKKALAAVAGAVVVAGIGATVVGGGDPDVGDCIQQKGASSFDTIDCDDAAAQFRVVGIEDDEVSESDFDAASPDQYCGAFPAATVVLWYGNEGSDGKVFCAEDV